MESLLALAIFIVAYGFIALEKFNRIAVALAGAAVMLALKMNDAEGAFFNHETGIDWNVILLLLGMMVIVSVIHKTGFFEAIAVSLAKKGKGNPKTILIFLCFFVAAASALLDNVTTIMLAVPMTIMIAKKLHISPIPLLLSEIFASNIGGAATLIGDPPNIIIASKANIKFNDFLIHMAPMVIVTMLVIVPFLVFLFRNQLANSKAERDSLTALEPKDFIKDSQLLGKSLGVLLITVLLFLTHPFTHLEPSIIALLGAGLLIAITRLKPREYALDIEWGTLLFFAGLFIMVGTLVKLGVLERFAQYLESVFDGRVAFATYSLLGISALLSRKER